MIAYLDRNVLSQLRQRSRGASAEDEVALRAARERGQLLIPLSIVTLSETLLMEDTKQALHEVRCIVGLPGAGTSLTTSSPYARPRRPSRVSPQQASTARSSSSVGTRGSVFGVRILSPASGLTASASVTMHQRQDVCYLHLKAIEPEAVGPEGAIAASADPLLKEKGVGDRRNTRRVR
jgi:hypothetical protein